MPSVQLWNFNLFLTPGVKAILGNGEIEVTLNSAGNELDIAVASTNAIWTINLKCKVQLKTDKFKELQFLKLLQSSITTFSIKGISPAIKYHLEIVNGRLLVISDQKPNEIFNFLSGPPTETLRNHISPKGIDKNSLKLMTALGFDFTNGFSILFYITQNPDLNNVIINEDLISSFDTIFSHKVEQKLVATSLALREKNSQAFLQINFEPSNKVKGNVFYINPYILDAALDQNNLSAYQYALVNGSLQYDYALDNWYWINGYALLLNYTDQNCNPLAISLTKKVQENDHSKILFKRIKLAYRHGNTSVDDINNQDGFQNITPGLVLEQENPGDQYPVFSIKPRSVDNDLKNKQLYNLKHVETEVLNILNKPYWIAGDGRVKIADKPPAEFYGLAKGTIYKPASNQPDITVSIQSENINNAGGLTIYHATHLEFSFSQVGILNLVEEKESFQGDAATAFTRSFIKPNQPESATIKVPATNYKIAAANIIDPKAGNTTITIIPKGVGDWLNKLQSDLNYFSADEKEITHESGFRRTLRNVEAKKATPKEFFSKAPYRTSDFFDTIPINLNLVRDEKATNFEHGAAKGNSDPFTISNPEHDFHFDALTDKTEEILRQLRRVKRFWNQAASYATLVNNKKAKAWQIIKFYLQKGPSALLSDTFNESQIFNIRPELKQFAVKPEEAKRIIGELQVLVTGNLNNINGLGSRVKLVRNRMKDLTETKLKEVWELKWEDAVKTPVDQVMFELLNYYYYPLDRKATTELAKLKRLLDAGNLSDEEQAIKTKLLELMSGQTNVDDIFNDIKIIIANEIADLDPRNDAEIEIKKIFSDAWLGVDKYLTQLEEMWKLIELTVTEFDKLRTDLIAIITSNDIKKWEDAEPRIRRFFSVVLTNWSAVRGDAKKLWDTLNQDRTALANQLFELFKKLHKEFIGKLDKFRSKYGPYFNPLSYKKIIEDIAQNKINDEIKFVKSAFKERLLGAIEDELVKVLSENIASYEEDILHLARMVNTWTKELEQANQHLENVLKAKKDEAKPRLKALRDNYRKGYHALQEVIASMTDAVLDEIDNQIDEFLDKNWDEFEDIQRFIATIRRADSALNVLVKDFKDLDGEFDKILKAFQEKPEVVRAFIVDYLLKKYNLNINLEDLKIDPPEYVVYGKNVAFNVDPSIVNAYNSVVEKLFASKFTLSSFGGGKKWNMVKGESAVFIIKLGNHLNIREIIEDIEKSNFKAGGLSPFGWDEKTKEDFFDKDLASLSELNTKLWRGIFIVNPLADISKDSFLNTLLGMSHFKMPFAAIGGKGIDDLNVYAKIKDKKEVADASEKKDVNFTVVSFDATIKNTKLVEGRVVTKLDIMNILGKEFNDPNKTPSVEIIGSIPPQKPGEDAPGFEFTAKLTQPLRVDMNLAFFKEINISKIRAANKQGKCYLEIDATVSFKPFMESAGLDNVSLKNFRIEIPAIPGGANVKLGVPRALNFDLDAIEFLLKDPKPLTLLGMELLPTGVGFIKEHKRATDFPGYFWVRNQPYENSSIAYIKLDIDFGNLTSLGSTDGQSLKLSGLLGYTVKNSQADNKVHFGINGGTFRNIDINLFRFIELKIQELVIVGDVTLKDSAKASVIYAKKAQLKLLNWSVLGEDGNANFMLMNENAGANRKGFYFLYKNDKPDGVLKIYWILISKGILMPTDKLTALLSLANIDKEPSEDVKDIPEAKKIETDPVNEFKQLAFTNDNNWLLGASFAIGDIFDRCAFILHDKHYYGIMVASKQAWFKAMFQTDKIALAYIPGRTKKEDRFRIEMPLPFLNFFGTLKSGLFALEIGVNKDFLFDLGFPWRVGNRYEWPRAFSSIQGIYELKFGVYFEKRTEYTPENNNIVTIGAGIGLYYGYHVGGRTPIAWAEAGIGLFIILSGQAKFLMKKELTSPLSLLNASLVEITVTGVIGIYAYAEGGINYWVISASFRAEIQAAIAGTLIYRPHGESALFYEAMLSARFSASARVKLGFVKITVSISGSVGIHVGGKIALN